MPRMAAGKRMELETFWRAHLDGWRRSDLNQREYCELHGLALKRFGNWRATLRPEELAGADKLLYRRGGVLKHMPKKIPSSPSGNIRKLLKKQGFAPKRIMTDKLNSHAVAICKERLLAIHDQDLRANNRAENSHQPVCRRERKQQRFKSPGSAQRFLSIHAAGYHAFYVRRHVLPDRIFKEFRAETFPVRNQGWLAALSGSRSKRGNCGS